MGFHASQSASLRCCDPGGTPGGQMSTDHREQTGQVPSLSHSTTRAEPTPPQAPTSRYRATKDKIRRPEPSALYRFLPRVSSSRVVLPGVLRQDTPSLFHLTSLLLRCTRHVREKWQLLTFKRWSPSSRLPFSFLSILHLPPISRSTYPCVDGLGEVKPQQCYLFVLA